LTAARKELRRHKPMWLATGLVVLVALTATLVFALGAFSSLPGSPFEATDGNLVSNGGPDWAVVTEQRKNDLPTGQTDDSFGQGTKEDTPVPTVVAGQIPNNKSDLKTFGVYNQPGGTAGFMELFWTRVQDPNGTTNIDFEFNQSSTISANGKTPVRTAGDVLIQYDLDRGGTVPTLSKSPAATNSASGAQPAGVKPGSPAAFTRRFRVASKPRTARDSGPSPLLPASFLVAVIAPLAGAGPGAGCGGGPRW